MARRVFHITVDEPEWTDAEHAEIMRLHIIEGLTIGDAKLRVFEQRSHSGIYEASVR